MLLYMSTWAHGKNRLYTMTSSEHCKHIHAFQQASKPNDRQTEEAVQKAQRKLAKSRAHRGDGKSENSLHSTFLCTRLLDKNSLMYLMHLQCLEDRFSSGKPVKTSKSAIFSAFVR